MNEMRKQQFTEAHTWVRAELDRCVNFWLKNGMDPEFGGVYTCLDRTGKIYSTDKSVWMQGLDLCPSVHSLRRKAGMARRQPQLP